MAKSLTSKRKSSFFKENRYLVMTIVATIVLCFIPLSLMATTKGHDYGFHLQRIQALADELSAGNHLPRIFSTMLGGNGYATPLFYGDILLRIPAYLMVWFDYSLTDAYAVFVAFIFAASVLSMYFCTVSITKSKKAGFCGAVMFGLSSYLVTDLIQRCALGEAQSFIFIPIAFAGLYHILYGEIDKWYLLPIGLAAMIYCHTLSALITVFVFVLFLLFSIGKIKENPFRLVYLAISAVIFFALSAYFMFPMLEQLSSHEFLATDGFSAVKWGTLKQRSLPWWALFYDFATMTDVVGTYIPNGIGLSGLVFAIIFFVKNRKSNDKFIRNLIIMSAIILFLTTNLFPWDALQNLCGLLQFPWRLLVYPTFFLALGAAMYFGNMDVKKSDHANLMYLVIAISLFSYVATGADYFNTYMGYQAKGTELKYDYVNKIGAAEYLPSSDEFEHNKEYGDKYKNTLILHSGKVFSDGSPTVSIEREVGVLTVKYSGMNKDDAYLDMPVLMYKGYSATLDDGTELECTYGTYNRIRVNVGDHREGTVTVRYTGTTIQTVSGVVTVVSIVLMIAYLALVPYIRKKKKTTEAVKQE